MARYPTAGIIATLTLLPFYLTVVALFTYIQPKSSPEKPIIPWGHIRRHPRRKRNSRIPQPARRAPATTRARLG